MTTKYLLPCFRSKGLEARKDKDKIESKEKEKEKSVDKKKNKIKDKVKSKSKDKAKEKNKDIERINKCSKLCNEIIEAFERSKGKLEATWKAMDVVATKPNYQKLASELYDILYTGNLLTKDGKLTKSRSSYCFFQYNDEPHALKLYEQLFQRLRRRHKHLDAAFDAHAQRFLTMLPSFDPCQRRRLARLMTQILMTDQLNPRTLLVLGKQKASIDEGLALEFMLVVSATLKREKGSNYMLNMLKRSGLDMKIISFMPPMLRSDLYFQQVYQESDLNEIIKMHEERAGNALRRQLQQRLLDDFKEKLPQVDVVRNVRQFQREHHMSDSQIIGIVWQTINSYSTSLGSSCSLEQTQRKLQIYAPLLNALCNTENAQIALLLWLQDWCCVHHSLFKFFERLAVHLYKAGVVNEDAIMRWYQEDHNDKGKVAFLGQMRRFVHWLHTDSDANCRVDYNTYLTNQKVRRQIIYSDVVPSINTKYAKYH